jgi:hypothetical protein
MRVYALSAKPMPACLIVLIHTEEVAGRPGRGQSVEKEDGGRAQRETASGAAEAARVQRRGRTPSVEPGQKVTPFVAGGPYGAEVEGECEMRVDPKRSESREEEGWARVEHVCLFS